MIELIRLRNFQGHTKSAIPLTEGVNVIAGRSDSGKSSIIRALGWLLRNRPQGGGDLYRHHAADKADRVSVSVEVDGAVITRFKQGSKNGYLLEPEADHEPLELVAVRSDVPEEVAGLLRIHEDSVQGQHRPIFLLSDSPGDVARRLNEVCGLDIIDECLRSAGTLDNRNASAIRETKIQIEKGERLLEQFPDLDALDARLRKVERWEQDRLQVVATLQTLRRVVREIGKIQSSMVKHEARLKIQDRVEEVAVSAEQVESLRSKLNSLRDITQTIRSTERSLAAANDKAAGAEERLHDLLDGLDVCPVCERPMHEAQA